MKYVDTIAFCPQCGGDVWVRCPAPRHLLHLTLTLLTLGLWSLPWLILTLLSGPCRCARCGYPAEGNALWRPAGDWAHPWEEGPIPPFRQRPGRIDFNTFLVEKGLVFYASTRSHRV